MKASHSCTESAGLRQRGEGGYGQAYAGTKFALEAMTDALRLELMPFGIKVSLIEPGAIGTQFEQKLRNRAEALIGNPNSPYRQQYVARDQISAGLLTKAPGPELVSAAIQRAIESRTPKARYSMPAGQTFQLQVLRLLPDALKDYHLVARLFAIQRHKGV